tara:strand:- start:1906 stop:2739 length:834 start_codon:yes stop_codon:yes gene_type:complete
LFTYIDNIEDLSLLNKELLDTPYLGLDTEFRRTTKDNMKLSLLQVNDGEEIYLIDAVLISNPKNECDFLFSDSVIKIFHSCKEDLEAIHSWTGRIMVNLFDTQLANALLDGEYSIGYQGLVEEKLEIILDKQETRSNWMRRPLSDSQLNYAATDVEYLIHLFNEQEKELIKSNKIDWLNEEINSLISLTFEPIKRDDVIASKLNKSEESNLLRKFNEIVIHLAEREEVNPTLLFSKKNQKEFLRRVLNQGFKDASKFITNWRKELIKAPLEKLILDL